MIDNDQMPPDWKLAQKHAKSCKVGSLQKKYVQDKIQQRCDCCLNPIQKTEISLWNNSKQLQFLGFGFPLYFIFVKYCMVLIFGLIVTYSGMSLFSGIHNSTNFCSHRQLASSGDLYCTSFMVMFSRIQTSVNDQQHILRVISFVAHICMLIYFRDSLRKTMEYYDQKTTSLSDFTILIRNLPIKEDIEKNLRNFLNDFFKLRFENLKDKQNKKWFISEDKVRSVVLLPNLKQFYDLCDAKKDLIKKKRNLFKKLERSVSKGKQYEETILSQIKEVDSKIKEQNNILERKKNEYYILGCDDKIKCDKSIIILESQIYKNTVLEESQKLKLTSENLKKYFGQFQGQLIIKQAPEPKQIIWTNINYTNRQKNIGKVIGWSLSILTIVVITFGFYFLVVLKTKNLLNAIERNNTIDGLHHDPNYKLAVFIVYLCIVSIVLFNKIILGYTLHYFTHLQKHETTSDAEFSFCVKYSLAMFFTTALMTLAVQDITFHNFYTHEYGVIEEESIMFFTNAIFVPLIWLMNPWQIYLKVLRYLKKDKKYLTQQEANMIMSDPPYKMGKRYAEIIQTMWFTFLYATLIPVGAFFTFLGLIFYYWVDKYNLLRRSSLTQNISGRLAVVSLKLLDFTLVLRPLGTILFDYQLRKHVQMTEILFGIVGIIYVILPINDVLNFFHHQKFNISQYLYDEIKQNFKQTYESLNPIQTNVRIKRFSQQNNSVSTDESSTNQLVLAPRSISSIPQVDQKETVLQQKPIIYNEVALKQEETQRKQYHIKNHIIVDQNTRQYKIKRKRNQNDKQNWNTINVKDQQNPNDMFGREKIVPKKRGNRVKNQSKNLRN